MGITSLSIKHMQPLNDVNFECDQWVNLFIGPNASGKSTLLRAINSLLSDTPEEYSENEGNHYFTFGDWDDYDDADTWLHAEVAIHLPRYFTRDGTVSDLIPILCVPATRISLAAPNISERSIERMEEAEDPDDLYDGLKELLGTNSSIFDGQCVLQAIDWSVSSTRLNPQRLQFRSALQAGYDCARHICSEVILDGSPHPYVGSDGNPQGSPGERSAPYGMGIGTNDDPLGVPLYAGVLSSGTQGTLIWIYALAIKLANHYSWEDGWREKPGILLIDEIENHLHPTWQRRVIPALLEHFPGLQIFATTHSPFIVAGLRAGQVHLLKRDADGAVTASTNQRDIIGWTTDEILRTFMGVDEPTDQLTVNRATRLRELRGKETLSEAEAEEMTELRRQVNEDFISSNTPLEAQRQRYGDMMLEFLRSRQSELSQDGS